MKRPRLTYDEIDALRGAARNVDPCMFEDGVDEKTAEKATAAWLSGIAKLEAMLDQRDETKAKRKR